MFDVTLNGAGQVLPAEALAEDDGRGGGAVGSRLRHVIRQAEAQVRRWLCLLGGWKCSAPAATVHRSPGDHRRRLAAQHRAGELEEVALGEGQALAACQLVALVLDPRSGRFG